MKLFYKVSPLEVKRAFVTAQRMRFFRKKGTKYLSVSGRAEFLKKLNSAKKTVEKLKEEKLDKIVAGEYKRREKVYNNAEWYRARVSAKEVGVWRRASKMPSSWTCCSLPETASFVKKGLENKDKRIRSRSKRAIPGIMAFADIISKEKRLFPIVFKGGTGTKGRGWCRKKMKGDIDDGCMRAIALTIAGYKTLNVYFGKPKKKL